MKYDETGFNEIRNSIIETIKENETFKDYNFNASGISSLVDALAYLGTYTATYANFAINETFLNSAQLRQSVVSNAKNLGYVPYQYKSSNAKIKLNVKTGTNINEGEFVPKGTVFLSGNSDLSYQFLSDDKYYFEQDEIGNWYVDINLIQGTYVKEIFSQDEFYINKYILSNKTIDVDKIEVFVYNDEFDTTGTQFFLAEDISMISPNSNIFYIQESFNNSVEIYFGDGVLGKKLSPYNRIEVNYLVTAGQDANNITSFALASTILGYSSIRFTVEVLENSHSGANKEENESIKFNAPRQFQRQNRNVTSLDYETAVLSKYGGWIEGIKCWGGEDNDPPQYGKMIFVIKPIGSNKLSELQKNEIIDMLQDKNMPCVSVVINDPNIIKIDTDIYVDYYSYKLNVSLDIFKQSILNSATNYYNDNLVNFSSFINYSKLLSTIMNENAGIESINISFKMKQDFVPENTVNRTYSFDFCNPIKKNSFILGPYTYAGEVDVHYIRDDGNGTLILNNNTKMGTIDYETGKIFLNDHLYSVPNNTIINVECVPDTINIYTNKTYILNIDNNNLKINKLNT